MKNILALTFMIFCIFGCSRPVNVKLDKDEMALIKIAIDTSLLSDISIRTINCGPNNPEDGKITEQQQHEFDSLKRLYDTATLYVFISDTLFANKSKIHAFQSDLNCKKINAFFKGIDTSFIELIKAIGNTNEQPKILVLGYCCYLL